MDSTMGRDIVTISGRTGRSRIKASFIVSAYLLNSGKKPHSAPAGSCVAKRDQWPEKSTTCFSRHYCTENGRFVKGERRIFQRRGDSWLRLLVPQPLFQPPHPEGQNKGRQGRRSQKERLKPGPEGGGGGDGNDGGKPVSAADDAQLRGHDQSVIKMPAGEYCVRQKEQETQYLLPVSAAKGNLRKVEWAIWDKIRIRSSVSGILTGSFGTKEEQPLWRNRRERSRGRRTRERSRSWSLAPR